jgi:preprotein translocase subunit YajC
VNSPGFLIVIVAFGVLWFVLIRPQKRRQIEAKRMLSSVQVGDDVITAGGIYGEVTELHDDDVLVRIAPQLEVRVARKAIGAIIPKDEAPAEDVAEPDEPDSEPAVPTAAEHDG